MFAGAKKDSRDVGGEGAVFAGSKKCTRNSTDCLLCLRVLKRIAVMLVERVLCLRVQKNAPATVLIAYCVCGYSKRYPQYCVMMTTFSVYGYSKRHLQDYAVRLRSASAGTKKDTHEIMW